MRWLSSAICTSGEPVSPSVVAYSAMILLLVSASVPTDIRAPSVLSLRGAPGPVHPGTLDPRPMHGGCHPIGQLHKIISAGPERRIGAWPAWSLARRPPSGAPPAAPDSSARWGARPPA